MSRVEKLVRLMKARGVSQARLEREAGLAPYRIAKWKAGQGEPTARQALAMAEVLGVVVEDVIDPPDVQAVPILSVWSRSG